MTRLLTHNGQTDSICGWAVRNGITKSAMYQRLERGWTLEEACTNKRVHRSTPKAVPTAPVVSTTTLRLDELERMDLMLRREVTRALRQFNRDLEAIMRRGVVHNLPKWPVDRSIPVARDRA